VAVGRFVSTSRLAVTLGVAAGGALYDGAGLAAARTFTGLAGQGPIHRNDCPELQCATGERWSRQREVTLEFDVALSSSPGR
jgi:hypothetical protein